MHSATETAVLFGVDAATIRRWRVKAGLEPRQEGGGYSDEEIAQLAVAAKRPNPLHAQPTAMHAHDVPSARAALAEAAPDLLTISHDDLRAQMRDVTLSSAQDARLEAILHAQEQLMHAQARIETQLAGIHALLEALLAQAGSGPVPGGEGAPVSDSPARLHALSLTPAEHGRIWGKTTRIEAEQRARRLPGDLPEGSVTLAAFAQATGTESTTLRHRTRIGGAMHLDVTTLDRGARDGRVAHWLTPAQQQAALAGWHRYPFPHKAHPLCPEPHAQAEADKTSAAPE